MAIQFQQNVNAIVKVHADIREHAKRFKNRIFPTIVDLASAIYNYSTTAKVGSPIYPCGSSHGLLSSSYTIVHCMTRSIP